MKEKKKHKNHRQNKHLIVRIFLIMENNFHIWPRLSSWPCQKWNNDKLIRQPKQNTTPKLGDLCKSSRLFKRIAIIISHILLWCARSCKLCYSLNHCSSTSSSLTRINYEIAILRSHTIIINSSRSPIDK